METATRHTGRVVLEQGFHAHQAGRFDEALALYETAIEHEPSQVAHNLAGVVLCALGRTAEGEKHFRKAVDLDPSFADAIINLANCQKELGGLDEAEALYKRSIELRPDLPPAWSNLGLLYLQLAQFDAAVQCFRRALSLDSTNANARNDLGVALLKLGLIAEAETEFRAVVDANPAHAAAWSSLGDVLQLRGLLDEAEKCFRAALTLSPMDGNVLNNLATVARRRRQFDVAQAYCDHVLGDNPRHIGALNNVGSLAAAQGDYVRAETVYRVALRLDPRHSSTRFNLATTLLTRGAYEEGFELYESRFDAFPASYRHANTFLKGIRSLPLWRGEHRPSDRLLIWGEQGLGDFVMMLRFIPEAAKRVGRLTVLCDPALRRLVECTAPATRVVTHFAGAEACDFDFQCAVMSLPFAFGVRLDTVPSTVPYLSIPPESRKGRERAAGAKPKVGIAWAGSKTLEDDKLRSIPFEHLAPLLALQHVEWVSLQKGDAARNWPAAHDVENGSIEDCDDLFDTAALITDLDLVISVDTVIAHLAGALGKPVWLLNRYASEWRWALSGEGSSWYPSMRIFRQKKLGDWAPVIDEIVSKLQRSGTGSVSTINC